MGRNNKCPCVEPFYIGEICRADLAWKWQKTLAGPRQIFEKRKVAKLFTFRPP